jgi:uncharacterized protein (DUF1697 family)
VATFRTSGNVVFSTAKAPEARIVARCEQALKEALGFEVAVLLRSAAEMRRIAAHEPFGADVLDASKGKLQVVLLPAKPTAKARDAIEALASEEDRIAVAGREVYWLPESGLTDSPIGMKEMGRAAGTNTIRTKGTIDLLAAKFF